MSLQILYVCMFLDICFQQDQTLRQGLGHYSKAVPVDSVFLWPDLQSSATVESLGIENPNFSL